MPVGFKQFRDLSNAFELKRFNDMLQDMYRKIYGGLGSENINWSDVTVPFANVAGGTLVVGSGEDSDLSVMNAADAAIAQMTNEGIWADGNKLRIKHPQGNEEMYLHGTRNLCLDHSFEMAEHGVTEDATHHDFVFIDPAVGGVHQWEIDAGAPKVFDDYSASYSDLVYVLFGGQSAAVNSANSLKYVCPIDGGRADYTVSVFAWPHPSRGTSTMQARIGFQYLDDTMTPIDTETLTTVTLTTSWSVLSGDGRIQNIYRVQSCIARPSNGQFIRVRLLSPGTSQWICYDGMQIAPYDKMCPYVPEDGAWKYIRNLMEV